MANPNPNFSVSSYHLHLMHPSLSLHHNHVHFMFRNSSHITTNQKQRYAGVVVSFSLSHNSQKQIKPKPARDRVIDFGKHKGNMLGTLPSTYLKWVSKKLRAGDFENWAKLADEVLADPVYKDRIEWEFALNVMTGDKASSAVVARSGSAAIELQQISERFGWDNDDQVGWSKVDFNRLGTSFGGRIPRLVNRKSNDADVDADADAKTNRKRSTGMSSSGRSKRMERRERQKMRLRSSSTHEEVEQEKENMVADVEEVKDDDSVVNNPFPGRQGLLRKAIKHRSILK